MADEYVDLVVRVPTQVVREFQCGTTLGTALARYIHAAALEFDLPPERVPVTPETPWGTVIDGPDSLRRRFLANIDDYWFCYDGVPSQLSQRPFTGRYDHGWYEAKRP
jgi:hypothetical protein